MDAYPDWAEMVRDGVSLTACQFPVCKTECRNFKQLLDHIKRHHSVTALEIGHHWIHEMAIHERNPQGLGRGEYDRVQLVWTDDGHVDEEKVCAFKPRARSHPLSHVPCFFWKGGYIARQRVAICAGPPSAVHWQQSLVMFPCLGCPLLRPPLGLHARAPPPSGALTDALLGRVQGLPQGDQQVQRPEAHGQAPRGRGRRRQDVAVP